MLARHTVPFIKPSNPLLFSASNLYSYPGKTGQAACQRAAGCLPVSFRSLLSWNHDTVDRNRRVASAEEKHCGCVRAPAGVAGAFSCKPVACAPRPDWTHAGLPPCLRLLRLDGKPCLLSPCRLCTRSLTSSSVHRLIADTITTRIQEYLCGIRILDILQMAAISICLRAPLVADAARRHRPDALLLW